MFAMQWISLAQTSSAPVAANPAIWVGVLIALFAVMCGYLWYRDREQVRKLRERELAAFQQRNQMEQSQKDRDGRAFNQHLALNDLQAKKVELETRVLQAQLEAADRDKRARQLQEEFHKLVVDKTSLEIQSLKLHIKEQMKRNDDFTSYDEE